eukprot:TRINITY_DN1297_c0_g1_i1.p1 TRINITY_DN1297_c0_g1~~TRINITY_DN1297_c0_g1_i1.p1  ORF type:complete len:230 (-),score=91.86 TRINITY_DN1297_c0_g1_i1:99-743(-)
MAEHTSEDLKAKLNHGIDINSTYPLFTNVCVYCGGIDGDSPIFVEQATLLGQELTKRRINLVYGGGVKGLMGAVAKAVKENGGKVYAVVPEILNKALSGEFGELILTKGMHERKAKMFELSDAFIVLPGGLGTFDEFFEILTWLKLGIHRKPIGVLNIDGFFDSMLVMIENCEKRGFVSDSHGFAFIIKSDIVELLDALYHFASPVPITRTYYN